jgi:phasin
MNKKPEVATKKPEAKKSTPKKPESAEVTAKREAAKREVVAKKFEAAKADVAAKREAAKPKVAAQKLAAAKADVAAKREPAKPEVAAKKLAAAKADVTTKKSAALRADVATKREAAKPEVAKKLAAAKPGVAARREAVSNVRETSHKSSGQIGFLLANPFPQATREFAEKTVVQTREAFDRSNVALEAAVDTLERTFDAAAQGAFALNRKIIEIARQNLDSSFDLAKSLVGAKNLAEIVELQAAYWGKLFGALRPQTEEVRTLASNVATNTVGPTNTQASKRTDARVESNEANRNPRGRDHGHKLKAGSCRPKGTPTIF